MCGSVIISMQYWKFLFMFKTNSILLPCMYMYSKLPVFMLMLHVGQKVSHVLHIRSMHVQPIQSKAA